MGVLQGSSRDHCELQSTIHPSPFDPSPFDPLNGLDFVKAVRSNSVYADLPIILVTTELEMAQLALTFVAGVDEYIMKPFDPIMIQEKL